mmetsp:Transcript_9240/g.17293  ORF Transcript_9240/g.17293 Transcript_9240/m.17293 type:complete len:215 (+) Transcript_9240:1478-2122(+)
MPPCRTHPCHCSRWGRTAWCGRSRRRRRWRSRRRCKGTARPRGERSLAGPRTIRWGRKRRSKACGCVGRAPPAVESAGIGTGKARACSGASRCSSTVRGCRRSFRRTRRRFFGEDFGCTFVCPGSRTRPPSIQRGIDTPAAGGCTFPGRDTRTGTPGARGKEVTSVLRRPPRSLRRRRRKLRGRPLWVTSALHQLRSRLGGTCAAPEHVAPAAE